VPPVGAGQPPTPPTGPTQTGAGATTWYFAEGYTGTGFDQYLTILNPNDTAASIKLTYLIAGGSAVERTLAVAPASRVTVPVHDAARNGVGRGQEVSTIVESTNGVGVIAERPIYFTYRGSITATGGHASSARPRRRPAGTSPRAIPATASTSI
jgi:hypothetical protein